MSRASFAFLSDNRRWLTVGICCPMFLLSMFYRVSNAVISPRIMAEFHLTNEQLGLLAAAFFYAFAVSQIPVGFLLDRFGARKTMTFFSILGGIGAVVFAKSGDIHGLIAGRVLLGIGMASNLMGALKLFTEWFEPREFATVSGVLVAVGTMGAMMATSPLVILTEAMGWRGSFVFLGFITIALAACFYAVVRDRPGQSASAFPTGISLLATLKTVFLDRNYWAISMGAFMRYGVHIAIQALWAGPFLMGIVGISPLAAGNLLLIMNIGSILGAPIGGFLSDQKIRSRKKTVLIGFAIMAASFLALSGYSRADLVWLGLIFFGIGFGSSFCQVMYVHIKELMPSHMAATAMSGINFFTMAGGAIFLHGVGMILSMSMFSYLSEGSRYRLAFLICFLGLAAALVVYLATRDTRVEKIKNL
jgi:MFS family permease